MLIVTSVSQVKLTFTITPKCCLAGGRLTASIQSGPLKVWFDAWADFLIQCRPFHFIADGGIRIGVSCKVDLWIVSFTISVEFGATLYLEGQPLSGRVYIDFWVTSFNINFGHKAKCPDPINLEDFYHLVLQSAEKQDSFSQFLMSTKKHEDGFTENQAHVFGYRDGMMGGDEKHTTTQESEPWKVRSGSFTFCGFLPVCHQKGHGIAVR